VNKIRYSKFKISEEPRPKKIKKETPYREPFF
jgi:hypothetical protein